MISIVIPTYNERTNITPLLREIVMLYPSATIIVVDDSSRDGTLDEVKKLQKKYSQIHLLIRKNEKGRGGACIAGFQYILKNFPKTSYILEMDSDFSHAPGDIRKLISAAKPDTIIIGSRYTSGSRIIDWPKYRLFLSMLANWYIRFFLNVPIRDYTMGFRCYSNKALQSIDFKKIKYKGFITLSETAYVLKQKGFRFKEVPITLKDRTRGKSHANLQEVLKSFIAVLDIRLRPY